MEENIQNETHDTCQAELRSCKERYLYLNAEFDNYKKRIERDRAQWISSAQAIVLSDTLPILDDFQRALAQLEKQKLNPESAAYLKGFELIEKSFEKLLKKYEIEEITDTANFNPELHEAIAQVNSNEYPAGSIIEVFEKGYKHKGQVLRPSKVSVAQ